MASHALMAPEKPRDRRPEHGARTGDQAPSGLFIVRAELVATPLVRMSSSRGQGHPKSHLGRKLILTEVTQPIKSGAKIRTQAVRLSGLHS